jgi:hypothetical protein
MGYYTIWLAPVKRIFVPFWEFEKKVETQPLQRAQGVGHPPSRRCDLEGNCRRLTERCTERLIHEGGLRNVSCGFVAPSQRRVAAPQ